MPSPPKANPQKRGASGSPQGASPRPGQVPAPQRQATTGSAVPASSSQSRLSVRDLLNPSSRPRSGVHDLLHPKSPSPAAGQPPAPQVQRQSSISSLRSTGSASSLTSRPPPPFLAQASLQNPPQAGPPAGQPAPQRQGAGRDLRSTPPPKKGGAPLSAILSGPSRANSPRPTAMTPPPRQNTGGSAAPARQQVALPLFRHKIPGEACGVKLRRVDLLHQAQDPRVDLSPRDRTHAPQQTWDTIPIQVSRALPKEKAEQLHHLAGQVIPGELATSRYTKKRESHHTRRYGTAADASGIRGHCSST
jgi:hypothetical protein